MDVSCQQTLETTKKYVLWEVLRGSWCTWWIFWLQWRLSLRREFNNIPCIHFTGLKVDFSRVSGEMVAPLQQVFLIVCQKKPSFRKKLSWSMQWCGTDSSIKEQNSSHISQDCDAWLTAFSFVLHSSPVLARYTPFHSVLDNGHSTYGVGLFKVHNCCAGERLHPCNFWGWWHLCNTQKFTLFKRMGPYHTLNIMIHQQHETT